MRNIAERFAALFKGLGRAHQVIRYLKPPEKPGDKYETSVKAELTPPLLENYISHLNGGIGLGIYLINEDNKCFFGAIDIDD